MKYFFFIILLCNIIFFLWEFNSRPIIAFREVAESKTKQILLLSELPKKQIETAPVAVANNSKLENVDNFKPAYNKFVLDDPIEILSLNFEEPKISANVFDHPDSYIADFLKPLNIESQEYAKSDIEFNAEQKNIEETGQDSLHGGIAKIKQDNEAEKQFCYQVGTFSDEKKLSAWIKLNNLDEDAITSFNQKIKTVNNYLVYYPRAKTYALSKNNAQLFKSKGIKDYWLFTEGKLKGVFSLGLLKKEKRALLLQKKLAKKGLNTEIMPRYKLDSVWFAKILSKEIMTDETISISDKQSLSSCDNI